jgi:hypothetical protein
VARLKRQVLKRVRPEPVTWGNPGQEVRSTVPPENPASVKLTVAPENSARKKSTSTPFRISPAWALPDRPPSRYHQHQRQHRSGHPEPDVPQG